ncbi:MAG: hypothetical protein ABI609_14510 [Acidobacteriota bacterium]
MILPRRDVRASVLLALLCLLIYNSNLRGIGAGDTLPARYQPFAIWQHGSLLLDRLRDAVSEGALRPFWIVPGRNGHSISLYPVVVPLVVAPLYLPAVGYLHWRGWTEWRLQHVAIVMEKLTASLLAALAAGLFYVLLRRRAPPVDAAILTLVFALGTNTWMIGSQALWQHGLAELLLVGALLLLTGGCTTARALVAGAVLGLIACNRPPDVLLAAPLALYGTHWAGRKAWWIAAGAALPLSLVLVYNLAVAGNLLGGYGIPGRGDFFRFGLLAGVAGMLFSPARGLLVFSPFLFLVPAAIRHGWRDRGARALTLAIGLGALAQLLFYAKADWRGGYSWGPRWLTDVLPLLVWLLPPAFAALRGFGRAMFGLAACASIAVQCVGAFWYTGASERAIFAGSTGPDEMRGAWEPNNSPILAELRHPPAHPDPAFLPWRKIAVRGTLDRATANGLPTEPVTAGAQLLLEGWALAGDAAPGAVQATLDGSLRSSTDAFIDRRDVRAVLHTSALAGWQLAVDTHGLREGRHALVVRARLRDSALTIPFAWREIAVAAAGAPVVPRVDSGTDPLAEAARKAAALLRSHQQQAGYWLTQYTGVTRFEAPHPEMNTFLTAMMIDQLEPIAMKVGLEASLAEARAHLRGQIEGDGLVRYHGLPDGPTMGTLGCRITPDTDDTTLAWRLAPGDRALLPRALAALARYRTDAGLYRTWLAPRERYECIDPGKDPNPTDVGIQMNAYLFLAHADPAAARTLCRALGTALAQDRLWVYYDRAPLVPLLRQADLGRAGCALRLPSGRLTTTVAGQETWMAVAKSLTAPAAKSGSVAASRARLDLLRSLADDNFAAVRQTPPLLYHNDLSAGVRRYYWSEDFGYALWLRLYLTSARERRAAGERQ